jgi:hypothetical protein
VFNEETTMKHGLISIIIFCICCTGYLNADIPQMANWTEINSSAAFSPRGMQGGIAFNDHLWIIAGNSNGTLLNDVWSSSDGNNWTLVTPHAEFAPRWGEGIATFKGKLWIIGGGIEDNAPMNDVWSSNDGRIWTLVTSHAPFSPRIFPGVTVFNNRLWVIGGSDTNDIWSSEDGVNWTLDTIHAEFTPRYGHGVAAFNNELWVLGGDSVFTTPQGSKESIFENDIWSSENGVQWIENKELPANYEFCPVIVYDNKMWIVGGGGLPSQSMKNMPTLIYNTVWSSSDGNNWSLEGSDPGFSPRYGHSVVKFDNALWIMGGIDENLTNKNDVWSYRSPDMTVSINNTTPTLSVERTTTIANSSFPIPTKAGFNQGTLLLSFFVLYVIYLHKGKKDEF